MPIQLSTDDQIEAQIASLTGGRILDVATGNGWLLAWLLDTMQTTTEGVGIDLRPLDAAALDEEGVFNRENVEFLQMDAASMDFPDGSFDTVAISNALHHMPDVGAVLAEMRRVLKPGGHLIVLEMYRDQQDGPQMTHILMHHWWANIDSALGIMHRETYTRAALVDLIAGLGLQNVALLDASFGAEANPHDPDRREVLLKRITHYLDRAKDLPEYPDFEARAKDLKLRLLDDGFRSANTLVAVGQKPG